MGGKLSHVQAINHLHQGSGLKIMILMHLFPLIQYNVLDDMSGITSILLWMYSAMLLVLLPGMIMLTFIAAAAFFSGIWGLVL